jgi:hypothetical protein
MSAAAQATTNPMMDIALGYANKSWPVFPCNPSTKRFYGSWLRNFRVRRSCRQPGSKAALTPPKRDFCCYPSNGHRAATAACRFRANMRHRMLTSPKRKSRLAAGSQIKTAIRSGREVALLRRRYAMKPTPAKPRIIIAHVEGSGTAPVGEPFVTPSLNTS